MGRLISNLIAGAGSILNLMPSEPPPFRFRVRTADERMRDAWQRVGISLDRAMDTVDQELKSEPAHATDRADTTAAGTHKP